MSTDTSGCADITTLAAGGHSGPVCSNAAFTSGDSAVIDGDVSAAEAVTLGANSKVHGNIAAGAAFTSGANAVVDGSVSAGADATTGANSVIKGSLTARDIILGVNSKVIGAVHSLTGVITYGAGAKAGS